MFNKKNNERPRRQNRSDDLSQYGLFDMSVAVDYDNEVNMAGDPDDSDLEAELAALVADGGSKPKRPPRKAPAIPSVNLDSMVQESLKDIPSDEDLSDNEDDPDLLNELSEIAGETTESPASPEKPMVQTSDLGKLLEERLKMYQLAESNAKSAGESSRARRFNRGIKTLNDFIKQHNAGRPINEEDIPPPVAVNLQKRPAADPAPSAAAENEEVGSKPSEESPSAEQQPQQIENLKNILTDEQNSLLAMLKQRHGEYKAAALKAKNSGDMPTAVSHIKIVKQFEKVIQAVQDGQEVDLSRMPGPPVEQSQPKESTAVQQHEETPNPVEVAAEPEMEEGPPVELITASSVAEALQQRLEVYKQQEAAAKEAGNLSKARRMGRIVKQFEQAIKLNNAGKAIPVDELPTPPGYAPIPVPGAAAPPAAAPEVPPRKRDSPKTPEAAVSATPPPVPARTPSRSGNKQSTRRLDQQLSLLQARQKEFKLAALNAKKKGEIAQAKEYLRSAKGFDPLIEATLGGLPVDIASLPIPPSAKTHLDEYVMIVAEECTEDDEGVLDVLSRLELQLNKQLKTALSTRDHHKALGDVAGMNRFEHLALAVTKDLDVVRIARRTNGVAVPKFHYEKREYSIVKSFTELNDHDLELLIVRGINYNCANPKDIDTYVKFEFPNPQDEIYRDKTAVVKDTNNPEYNAKFILSIQRNSRAWQRIFKRQGMKMEVYSRGGFLRSDTLLGTVNIKLQPLETRCEIHDTFDLMEGRKKVGGKLEVRLRVRDPLVSKEVEQLSERWLVIDH